MVSLVNYSEGGSIRVVFQITSDDSVIVQIISGDPQIFYIPASGRENSVSAFANDGIRDRDVRSDGYPDAGRVGHVRSPYGSSPVGEGVGRASTP
jgi:hypothetical protein